MEGEEMQGKQEVRHERRKETPFGFQWGAEVSLLEFILGVLRAENESSQPRFLLTPKGFLHLPSPLNASNWGPGSSPTKILTQPISFHERMLFCSITFLVWILPTLTFFEWLKVIPCIAFYCPSLCLSRNKQFESPHSSTDCHRTCDHCPSKSSKMWSPYGISLRFVSARELKPHSPALESPVERCALTDVSQGGLLVDNSPCIFRGKNGFTVLPMDPGDQRTVSNHLLIIF